MQQVYFLIMGRGELEIAELFLAVIYLQIKTMKDMYYSEINDMYQKIAAKLQQVCYHFTYFIMWYCAQLLLVNHPSPILVLVIIGIASPSEDWFCCSNFWRVGTPILNPL